MAEMMTELAQIEQEYAKKIAALAGKKKRKKKKKTKVNKRKKKKRFLLPFAF
jgi:hypothetical protein